MSLRFRSVVIAFATTAALLALPGTALAADACDAPTKTYDGPAGGNWSDAVNWTDDVLPTAADDVCITTNMVINGSPVANRVAIGGSASVSITAGIISNATAVDVRSTATVTQATTFSLPPTQVVTNRGTWNAGTSSTNMSQVGGRFVNDVGGYFFRSMTSSYGDQGDFSNRGYFYMTSNGAGTSSTTFHSYNGVSDHTSGIFLFNGSTPALGEIRFASSGTTTHLMTDARLTGPGTVRNLTGRLDMQGGLLELDAAFVSSGGAWLLDDTAPFDELGSSVREISFTGGDIVGNFTLPNLWTFNQSTSIDLAADETFTNHGTWNVGSQSLNTTQVGGRFVNASDGVFIRTVDSTYGDQGDFDNHGTFRLVATGTGPSSTTFNAYGTTAADHTNGVFEVLSTTASSAEIRFAYNKHVMTDATLQRALGSTRGTFLNQATLDLQSGGLKLDAPFANTGTWLVDNDGIDPVVAPFDPASSNTTIDWSNGDIVGDFTLPHLWTFNQNTTINLASDETFTNHGTWNVGSQSLNTTQVGGRFVNASDGVFIRTVDSTYGDQGDFDNHGTFRLVATGTGPSSTTLNAYNAVPADHTDGVFEVDSTTASSAEIRFGSGTHELTDATLRRRDGGTVGTFTEGGDVTVDPASTLRVDATATITSDQLTSGNLTLEGSGRLVVGGSTLDGTGALSIGAGLTLRASGATSLGSRTVDNDGTIELGDGSQLNGTAVTIAGDGGYRRVDVAGASPAVIGAVGSVQVNTTASTVFDVTGDALQFATAPNGNAEALQGTYTVSAGGSLRLPTNAAVIAPGSSVTLDGAGSSVSATNSLATVSGDLTVENGASVTLADGARATGTVSADVAGAIHARDLTLGATGVATGAGTLDLPGTVTVEDGGQLDLSSGTRTLENLTSDGVVRIDDADRTATGDVVFGATSTLEAKLSATDGGSLGGATMVADGTLQLDTSSFAPTPTYDYAHVVVIASTPDGMSGAFDDVVESVAMTAPRELDQVVDADRISLEVTELVAPPSIVEGDAVTTPAAGTTTVASSITVDWNAAVDGDSGTQGYVVGIDTTPGVAPTGLPQSATTSTFADLVPGTYYVTVRTVDNEGNESTDVELGPFTLTTPPAVGALVTSTPAVDTPSTGTSLAVEWSAGPATGIALTGFRSSLSASATASATGTYGAATSATFSDLAPGTYWVAVQAIDADGNEGEVRHFGPFRISDIAPPSEVGALVSSTPAVDTPVVASSITLAWGAATDSATGIAGYRASVSTTPGTPPTGATNGTTATFSGLAPASYYVTVRAVDGAGNLGPVRQFGPFVLAAPPVVTPPADPVPPVVVPPVEPPKDTTPPKVGTVPAPVISPTGIVTLKVPACPAGEASCRGTVKLETKVAPALLKARAKLVNFVLGTVKFTAKGGQTATVKLTLSKKAKAVLKKAKVLKVTTTITVTDAAGNKTVVKKTLTLKAPRKLR